MLGFGKKKTTPVAQTPKTPAIDEGQIHVMPERFYVTQKSTGKKSNRWLLIGGVVVGIGVIATIGLVWWWPFATTPQNTNQAPVVTNQNTNLNQPNAPLLNQEPLIPTSTPVEIPTTTPTTTPVTTPVASAVDADNDQLTLAEERLYGTDPTDPDSDGDTYNDGSELLNGYDPTLPGAAIAAGTFFINYSTAKYRLNYPASWQLKTFTDEVVFQAPSGEFFQVVTFQNSTNLSLEAWYAQQFPTVTTQPISVQINGLRGLRTLDARTYYFSDDQQPQVIFGLTYNLGSQTEAGFDTTFALSAKSFITINQ